MPICGVVLSGGKSLRMGHDKGQLVYYSSPQAIHCYKMLETLCPTIISCRKEQSKNYHGCKIVTDKYENCGPIAGLLSVYEETASALLVIACDLPFVTVESMSQLYQERDRTKAATIYKDKSNKLQPLCAIWEIAALEKLKQKLQCGQYSLMKTLQELPCKHITVTNPMTFINVNDNTARQKTISVLLEERDRI
ncbi:molybdenum cofactor guanylyltransferase [Candidatus Uabimicrobium sp. HlEnr_7]|uniref:molybdenum cofactor guanylyltransferase n=1 Tax=Candidatus Uabimicrobium helgolandensis TaxID=3095367 RepID=UPI003558A239